MIKPLSDYVAMEIIETKRRAQDEAALQALDESSKKEYSSEDIVFRNEADDVVIAQLKDWQGDEFVRGSGKTPEEAKEDLLKTVEIQRQHNLAMVEQESEQMVPYHIGKIFAIGEWRYNSNGVIVPMEVEVGQTVMALKHSGTYFETEWKLCYLIREWSLMAIVDDQE